MWVGTKRCAAVVGATIGLAFLLTACGGDPPQIVDYSPQRNTIDVSTAAPIRITFDHDVDRPSVEARVHLIPATAGSIRWESGRQLVYEHPTLRTRTTYEVVIEAGYRDAAGNVYTLRHHWAFVTEGPPSVAASTPAQGEGGVDPASYLGVDFTRAMNASTLKSAIAIYPTTAFDVRLDPADGRRAIIAPSRLLAANTTYKVLVNVGAVDVDGNQLDRNQVISFTTGTLRPLRHWIAFTTDSRDGSPAGLWIVNESGFPRQLFDSTSIRSFSWSPSGDSLLVERADESWARITPGGDETPLSFKAAWAASLAGDLGYVYTDDRGVLHRQDVSGGDSVITTDIAEAAVAPDGLRVAYIHRSVAANEVWGYDVGLRASYQLVSEIAPVSGLSWDPAGNRIAYVRHETSAAVLRVRSLTGGAATTTVSTGDIGRAAWLPDSTHVLFAATIATPAGNVQKAFVVNVASPPSALSLASALPSDPAIEVQSPVSSPDGHQIAFLSGDQVWLMNADGTRPTPLTGQDPASFPYSCRTLAWTRN